MPLTGMGVADSARTQTGRENTEAVLQKGLPSPIEALPEDMEMVTMAPMRTEPTRRQALETRSMRAMEAQKFPKMRVKQWATTTEWTMFLLRVAAEE